MPQFLKFSLLIVIITFFTMPFIKAQEISITDNRTALKHS
jgi:hypothetical protein